MSVLVKWPLLELSARVKVYRADDIARPYMIGDLSGSVTEFYDSTGTDDTVYRAQSFDVYDVLVDDTGFFQMPVNRAARLQTRVRLDHNYGGRDAHRYVNSSGVGLSGAAIRLFTSPDWEAQRRDVALQLTVTKSDGRWAEPLYVEPGFTYVLHVTCNGFRPVIETVVC